MKLDLISYFNEYTGSILAWAFLLFFLARLIVGFRSYSSAMQELKQSMGALLLMVFAIAYLISPIDLIPDIILILGWIDDAVITIGSFIYAQTALRTVFWGEDPPKNRFTAFLLWYGGSVVLTSIFKYTIYSV